MGGVSALSLFSETTNENEKVAYSKRMINQGRQFLVNLNESEMAARTRASEEFLLRLAEEMARAPQLTLEEVVLVIIDQERRNLGR